MPYLTIIAGPNGSGKSTFTRSVEFEGRERLIDPDTVARNIKPSDPASAAVAAGRESLRRIEECLKATVSFAVETTLSGRTNLDLIRRAKKRGYEVHFAFIFLDSPERCIARIRNRVALGGHAVPESDVRRRYDRSLPNSVEALRLADVAKFYDNSQSAHRLILIAHSGTLCGVSNIFPIGLLTYCTGSKHTESDFDL